MKVRREHALELGRVETLTVAFQEGRIPGIIGYVRLSLASRTVKRWGDDPPLLQKRPRRPSIGD